MNLTLTKDAVPLKTKITYFRTKSWSSWYNFPRYLSAQWFVIANLRGAKCPKCTTCCFSTFFVSKIALHLICSARGKEEKGKLFSSAKLFRKNLTESSSIPRLQVGFNPIVSKFVTIMFPTFWTKSSGMQCKFVIHLSTLQRVESI